MVGKTSPGWRPGHLPLLLRTIYFYNNILIMTVQKYPCYFHSHSTVSHHARESRVSALVDGMVTMETGTKGLFNDCQKYNNLETSGTS